MKEVLTTNEVAILFRVGQRTVYRWIASQRLDAFQTPGGHWRVHGASVMELFSSMTGGGEVRCAPELGFHSTPHRGCVLRSE